MHELIIGERCTEKLKGWYKNPPNQEEEAIKENVIKCAIRRSLSLEGIYSCDWCKFPPPEIVRR